MDIHITNSNISPLKNSDGIYNIVNSVMVMANNDTSIEGIYRFVKRRISELDLNATLDHGRSERRLWASIRDNGKDVFNVTDPTVDIYPLELGSVMDFGPYRGRTVEYALNRDHVFIEKCLDQIKDFKLSWHADFLLLEKQHFSNLKNDY